MRNLDHSAVRKQLYRKMGEKYGQIFHCRRQRETQVTNMHRKIALLEADG